MGLDHVLNGVGDDLPAGQGITHALVSLAQAVADGDGAELPGDAACLGDAQLYKVGDLPQMDVAGNHLRKRVDDGHHRLFQVLGVQAGAVEQGTVCRPLNTVGELAAAQVFEVHVLFLLHGSLLLFVRRAPVCGTAGISARPLRG